MALTQLFVLVAVVAMMGQHVSSQEEPEAAREDNRVARLPGRPCGDRQCLQTDARCEDRSQGICECRGNKQGDGYLACLPPSHEVCSIMVASTVTNFNNDRSFNLAFPCRFLAATFDTSQTRPSAVDCKIKIHGHGERVGRRYFVRGFDAAIVTEKDGTSEFKGYRARGNREDGEFNYILEQQTGPEEFWSEVTSIDEPDVQFLVEDNNARVKLDVAQCGLTIIYRPELASEGRSQTLVPGLVISVDKQAVDITWPSNPQGICLAPTSESGGPSAIQATRDLNLDRLASGMTYFAFVYSDRVLHPTSPCDCEDVTRTLRRCRDSGRRRQAMEMCQFILSLPPFVSCMEHRGHDASTITSLYDKCLEGFCFSAPSKCRRVQAAIEARNCANRAFDEFMTFDCRSL